MTKDEQIDAVRAAMTEVNLSSPLEYPIYPTREMLESLTEEEWVEFLGEE